MERKVRDETNLTSCKKRRECGDTAAQPMVLTQPERVLRWGSAHRETSMGTRELNWERAEIWEESDAQML